MKTSRSTVWLPGALLILAGAAVIVLARAFERSLPDEAAAAGSIVALVLIAWGIARLLYLAEKMVFRIAGPMLLLIGALVLIVSLMDGSLLGTLAGGFVAVVGAVLCLKK